MASCVAVALGIDYDIFLISRIVEFRMLGLSDSTSIIQGVARTGNIISGAGVIMSVAFSGLFFSDRLMHHQVHVLGSLATCPFALDCMRRGLSSYAGP